MKRFKSLAFGVGLACAGAISTGAHADILVDVYVYNGLADGTDANSTTFSNIISNSATSPFTQYEFKYSSLNDIVWSSANGTGGEFLGANLTNGNATFVTGAGLGTQAQFVNQQLSQNLPPFGPTPGPQNTSFFRITGTLNGAALGGTIEHDDGVTFSVGGQVLVNSPGLTSDDHSTLSSGFDTKGKDTAFELDFVEGNGPPAVLNVALEGANLTEAIPEISTWAMMILGFCGVGFMAYRRKADTSLRLA
jgi:hypothetical protein